MTEKSSIGFENGDNQAWAERSEYWRTYTSPRRGKGAVRKYNFRQPLILVGHGIRIRIDHNTLLIQNGFTHYPQATENIRFFPGDGNLPDRIIILDATGSISLDALSWMSEQKIELLRLDWRGEVISVAGNSGYSANPKVVARQRAIRGTTKELEIARLLIREKLQASVRTLEIAIPESVSRDSAISDIRHRISKMDSRRQLLKVQLLGIEGPAAQAYFRAWYGIPLKWKESPKRPFPESWRVVGPRRMAWKKRARAAPHPINAMLNYGYGILKSKIRSKVIAAGFDAQVGILHGNSSTSLPLIYDLMEPYRPVVDRHILEFALSHTFTPDDFTINSWGGCRLNPQMARVVANQVSDIEATSVVTDLLRWFQ